MAIRLWKRDFEIMLCLARNSFTQINQIQGKWFPSYASCIKRLKHLREEGYIDVEYISRNGSGIYLLTKNGIEFINSTYGTEYKRYDKNSKIPHFISCSEFYTKIPDENKIIDYQIEYYLDEFIPDIYLVYENTKETDYLIEIDNLGRWSRFESKIKKYIKFADSGKWRNYFTKFPRCIIVTNSQSYKDKFKDIETRINFNVIEFKDLERGLYKCLT